MESRSKNLRRDASRAGRSVSRSPHQRLPALRAGKSAPNLAVIDIGSNSVRLVVYEGMTRSPAPVFNEKILCGLGREVQTTGLLAADAVQKALASLRRFRALCKVIKVGRIYAIATAACREAKNGLEFIAKAERICGVPVEILSGPREAKLSALGVISGIYMPDGIVGDLGGGSLELIDVHDGRAGIGRTLPLGGLALQDTSRKSLKRAAAIVSTELSGLVQLKAGRGRNFYAVGGTWRALARIHIIQSGYPLRIMHGYTIPAADALDFVRRLRRLAAANMLADIETVAEARRPLLTYAALVLEHILRVAKPKAIVFSTYGVREGLLYEKLPADQRAQDGLIAAAEEMNGLWSRSPRHAAELIEWSDGLIKVAKLKETGEERRLRHAACLLSDIGWRTHPDYRGEQSMNLIIKGHFGVVSHQDRAFLALSIYYRYSGINGGKGMAAEICTLTSPHMIERARILGAIFRVAHLISAAQSGVLPATYFRSRGRKLELVFERKVVNLAVERVSNRFKQLTRLIGRSGSVVKI